jgi:predicted transcriptional regulator
VWSSLNLDIETKAKKKEYKNLPIEDYKKLMESEHKIKELTATVSEKQKANDELQQKCDELQQNYDDLYQKRHKEFEKSKKATALRQQEEQAAINDKIFILLHQLG